jgi:hypothetical protein
VQDTDITDGRTFQYKVEVDLDILRVLVLNVVGEEVDDTDVKKTRPGRGKPPSPTSPGAGTQGAHNPLMAKKLRNQQVPVEKTPEPWPPITNGPTTTAHSAMAQVGGWRAGDRTREWMSHNKGIF